MAAGSDVRLLVDLVIAITLIEFTLLLAWRRWTGRGVAARDFGLNMLSGLCLMFALRCLANGSDVAWIALFLLASGLVHGADMGLRWRRAGSGSM